jgi:tRNA pseudouridine-54 N-methylase
MVKRGSRENRGEVVLKAVLEGGMDEVRVVIVVAAGGEVVAGEESVAE